LEFSASLAGLWLLFRWSRGPALSPALQDPDGVFWTALLWGLGLYAALVLLQESVRIDGLRYFWLEDDAMVSMRYGARLAAGKGLTWTDGSRVQGYSNFLWTLAMALIHWAGSSKALASAWVLALNAACLAWLASAVRRLSLGMGASAMTAALAGLACALSYDLMDGALSGLEMVAVSAVMAEALAQGLRAEREGRAWPWRTFALAGLLPLLRSDGALPAVLVLCLGLRRRPGAGRVLAACLLALGPGLAQACFSHAYYGDWLPNTYYLKRDYWPGKYGDGALKLAQALGRYPLVLAAALAALGFRALRPWVATLAALALYCVWTGADYYTFLRFFAPGWPLFFALGFAASDRLSFGRLGAWPALALLLFSANTVWAFPTLLQSGWEGAQERLRVALYLERNIPPDQSLASAWAGTFFYFSGLPGVDLLGKCDPVVARSRPDPSLGGSGHNKLDLDRSLGLLKPDWVLLPAPSFSSADRAYLISPYDQRIAADPRFMAACLPHLRQISDHWTLCHCVWAQAQKTPFQSKKSAKYAQ
jgi:arabinofuranosyltransferase